MPTAALVIGGNRGLGFELVKQLHESGTTVVTTCRRSNSDLDSLGIQKVIEGVDISNPSCGNDVANALPDAGVDKFDFLYLTAGYFYPNETFDELNWEEELKMFKICSMGPLFVTQAVVKAGFIQEGSKICMITSEGGSIGLRTEKEGGGHYGHHMSKCAENMMGKILSLDLKPHGIPLVMVHPGFMKTKMTEHYSHLYEKFNAVTPAEAVGPIVGAANEVTLETTGRFIAPGGAEGLGLGAEALPKGFKPGDDVPW